MTATSNPNIVVDDWDNTLYPVSDGYTVTRNTVVHVFNPVNRKTNYEDADTDPSDVITTLSETLHFRTHSNKNNYLFGV